MSILSPESGLDSQEDKSLNFFCTAKCRCDYRLKLSKSSVSLENSLTYVVRRLQKKNFKWRQKLSNLNSRYSYNFIAFDNRAKRAKIYLQKELI